VGKQPRLLPSRSSNEIVTVNKGGGEKSDTKVDSAITSGLKNAFASALSAATCKTVLQPFDTLKTVQQHSEIPISLATGEHFVVYLLFVLVELQAALFINVLVLLFLTHKRAQRIDRY